MGQTREQRIIKQISGTQTTQSRTPIATDMFLPNHSGASSHPELKKNFMLKSLWRERTERHLEIDEDRVYADIPALPLTIPTYDLGGQAVHPSVLYFPEGWNGYRYWMAMSPYPNANDDYENPSILVSDDGQTWSVPAGLTNPITPMPPAGHLNDPDLLLGVDNYLYCYYGDVQAATKYIKCKSSHDGITWGDEETVLSQTDEYVSISVIHDDDTYKMWYVNITDAPNSLNYRTSTNPLTGWSEPTSCTFSLPAGREIWHIDVIHVKDKYFSLITTTGVGTSECYFASSRDGITWSVCQRAMLDEGTIGWAEFPYKGCMVYREDAKEFDVWFSAYNAANEWNIGYTIAKEFPEYLQVGGDVGVDGSFTTTDGKTVTVTKGLITSIV